MQWTFEDFQAWKNYHEAKGRDEIEDKLRSEFAPHGRQGLLELFDELVERLAFEEDMIVMKGRKPRSYAECCTELSQCLDAMKTNDERTSYNA